MRQSLGNSNKVNKGIARTAREDAKDFFITMVLQPSVQNFTPKGIRLASKDLMSLMVPVIKYYI